MMTEEAASSSSQSPRRPRPNFVIEQKAVEKTFFEEHKDFIKQVHTKISVKSTFSLDFTKYISSRFYIPFFY